MFKFDEGIVGHSYFLIGCDVDAFARYIQNVFVQACAVSTLKEDCAWVRVDVDRLSIWWVREEVFSKCLLVWPRVWFYAFSPEFVFYVGVGMDK